MIPRKKWLVLILFTLFLLDGFLWISLREERFKEIVLREKIATIKSKSSKIKLEIPELKERAKEVVKKSGKMFAPVNDPIAWYAEQMIDLHIEYDLDTEFSIRGIKVPFGMDLSRNLRELQEYVYPELAPYQIELTLQGTLPAIVAFLEKAKDNKSTVIIESLELSSLKEDDAFQGIVLLSYPQILYPEDFLDIKSFSKEKD